MHRSRLPLAIATAAASIALLAACSAPSATTDEPTTASVGGDVPELRAALPTETEPTPAPTPTMGPIPDGYTVVTDDEGVLSIILSEEWSDVDGRPFSTTDGREWASIIATPDAAAYPTDWEIGRIEFSGTAIGEQLSEDVATAFLTDLASPFAEACEPIKEGEPYDDGLYVGWFSSYDSCNGIGTAGVVVVAQDPDFNHFVFLRGKFTNEEERGNGIDIALSTFMSTQGIDKVSTGSRSVVPTS